MSSGVKKRPTERPQSISDAYFYRMLSPQALKRSKRYLKEEENVLKEFLATTPSARRMNFIAVGAGELWYLDYGLRYAATYVAIEPLVHTHYAVPQLKLIVLLEKTFGEVDPSDIPEGNSIYVFFFNVLSYIEHPISAINNLLREGDVLFVSVWNTTKEAQEVRKTYLTYLNSFEENIIIDPDKTIGVCFLDTFPFESLKYYKHHKRIQGKITDIVIIYT